MMTKKKKKWTEKSLYIDPGKWIIVTIKTMGWHGRYGNESCEQSGHATPPELRVGNSGCFNMHKFKSQPQAQLLCSSLSFPSFFSVEFESRESVPSQLHNVSFVSEFLRVQQTGKKKSQVQVFFFFNFLFFTWHFQRFSSQLLDQK